MAIELSEYRKSFLESAKARAAGKEDGAIASFIDEAASSLLEIGAIPDYELAFYTGTGQKNRKLRVDGYALDEYDWTASLFIADFSGEEESDTLTRTQAVQVLTRLEAFIEEAVYGNLSNQMEISRPAYDLLDMLRIHRTEIRKIRLFLLTDKIASERIESLPQNDFHGIPLEYHIWDMARFHRIYVSTSGRDELDINLCEYLPQGVPCLEAHSARTETYRSYLCVIPGIVLADIYDKYGSRLLEGNVRSFLNTKVAVNKKIRETILRYPEMFFAYNNGIAATATDVEVKDGNEGLFVTRVKDLQIVNGGQTTASISTARYRDKVDISKIFVQMKLTKIDPEKADKIIPNISRSSNSQNRVSEADFFANSPFHIRMEQISRRMFAPAVGGAQYETHWFYERARGQYLQEQSRKTSTEKSKFQIQNPKVQLITKTDLAKYHNSWFGVPHKVSMGAQKNFLVFAERITDAWDKNDIDFNDIYFQESVALAILFRQTEKLVSIQSWYEKGYRANIVTYSIALLAYLIKKGFPDRSFDFHSVWEKQIIDGYLERQMTILAKSVFDVLTAENRGIQNVTEWSKREACWERVKGLQIQLLPEAENWLADKEDVRSLSRSAKKEQKVMNGIEAQIFVVNLGAQYWQDMLQWASLKGLIASQEEQDMLTVATKMRPNSLPNSLPNSYQCRRLQEIRNKMLSEGFKES
ncbi:AIPR family protein [Dehalococcoides mccartyi]|uniref:AIPR family protein n=1 Tax=Dehalococcoides mccartyi TaxID=61435 RepID=UPI000A5AE8E0|nr:AIPR family protein [Dehalococcoides mccartyi]